jgi:hypothetical protein
LSGLASKSQRSSFSRLQAADRRFNSSAVKWWASLLFFFVRGDIDACEGVRKAIAKFVDGKVQNGFDAGKDPLN